MNKFTLVYGASVAVLTAATTVGFHALSNHIAKKNDPNKYKQIKL